MEIAHVEVEETPNWQSQLDLGPIFESLGREIAADASKNAPVDTGELRDSYGHEVVLEHNDGFNKALKVFSTVEHSIYVELGTSRMAAQPHLRPALEQKRTV